MTATKKVTCNHAKLEIISMSHHTTDLSDIFISLHVITTKPEYRTTTRCGGAWNYQYFQRMVNTRSGGGLFCGIAIAYLLGHEYLGNRSENHLSNN